MPWHDNSELGMQSASREAMDRSLVTSSRWDDAETIDGEADISYRQASAGRHDGISEGERLGSALAGAALVAWGLSRQSKPGILLAGLGGFLVVRGVMANGTGQQRDGQTHGSLATRTGGSAQPQDYAKHGIHVAHSVTINVPPEAAFMFWRDFTNLPKFMKHLKEVQVLDGKKSHWVAKGPLNSSIEWDAEIINEQPNEVIAWRSLPGSEVDNTGSVRFVKAPAGRGTIVRVTIDYIRTGGKFGSMVAKLFGEEPQLQIKDDLRRFKNVMEAMEIPTTEGQPRGQCKRTRVSNATE